jgi:hypothetical protein
MKNRRNIKYKAYLYARKRIVLKVYAKRKPSYKTTPQSSTWVVRELNNGEWLMPCFPEILWRTLKEFKYLGKIIDEPEILETKIKYQTRSAKDRREKMISKGNNLERIWICEECNCMFTEDEVIKDESSGKWGHICKAKKYKEEHRCESYLKPYILEKEA